MTDFVNICCNDSAGNFAGVAHAMRIGDIELEPHWLPAPALTWERAPDRLVLYGIAWRITGVIDAPGSIACTGFRFQLDDMTEAETLAAFVIRLQLRGTWCCTSGPSEFFAWFNGDYPAQAPSALVCRWLADAVAT